MEESLEELFIETKGKPVQIEAWIVMQFDHLSITRACHNMITKAAANEFSGADGQED
jgi:hypothetical protein